MTRITSGELSCLENIIVCCWPVVEQFIYTKYIQSTLCNTIFMYLPTAEKHAFPLFILLLSSFFTNMERLGKESHAIQTIVTQQSLHNSQATVKQQSLKSHTTVSQKSHNSHSIVRQQYLNSHTTVFQQSHKQILVSQEPHLITFIWLAAVPFRFIGTQFHQDHLAGGYGSIAPQDLVLLTSMSSSSSEKTS